MSERGRATDDWPTPCEKVLAAGILVVCGPPGYATVLADTQDRQRMD